MVTPILNILYRLIDRDDVTSLKKSFFFQFNFRMDKKEAEIYIIKKIGV